MFNLTSKEIDPKIASQEEYHSDLGEAKTNLQHQINRRLEYIANENENTIVNPRKALKFIDLEYVKAVTTRLKGNTTRLIKKIKQEESKQKQQEQQSDSSFSQNQETESNDLYVNYETTYKTSQDPEYLNNILKFFLHTRGEKDPKKKMILQILIA